VSKKNVEQIYIIILKYSYLAVIVVSLISKGELDTFKVVMLLLFVITNQVRYFLLGKRGFYFYGTIILEFLLACIIYRFGGEFNFLVFVPALIDVATTLPDLITAGYFGSMLLFCAIMNNSMDYLIIIAVSSLPILVLGSIFRDEYKEKIRAQKLYDKLREREEELKKANQELENYANTIEEVAVLRERNRLSREIHDNVGHALSTIIIQLGAIKNVALKNGKAASEMSAILEQFADESLQSIRAAVRSMKPREFEEYEGLVAISEMIKNFEKLSGIKVGLRFSDNSWKLNADQTMVIYRLVQEFLSNSLRHGKASEVKIFLNFMENSLRIYIKDNGIGCGRIIEGVGLKGIRERVKIWGGNIEYFSEAGKGFELVATIEKGRLVLDGR
jgi:signal transduction histidine kinase